MDFKELQPKEFKLRKNEYCTPTSPYEYAGHYMAPDGKVYYIALTLKSEGQKTLTGELEIKTFKGKASLEDKYEGEGC